MLIFRNRIRILLLPLPRRACLRLSIRSFLFRFVYWLCSLESEVAFTRHDQWWNWWLDFFAIHSFSGAPILGLPLSRREATEGQKRDINRSVIFYPNENYREFGEIIVTVNWCLNERATSRLDEDEMLHWKLFIVAEAHSANAWSEFWMENVEKWKAAAISSTKASAIGNWHELTAFDSAIVASAGPRPTQTSAPTTKRRQQ